MRTRFIRSSAAALSLAAATAAFLAPAASAGTPGAVYALTNATTGNEVVVWARGADGSLEPAGEYPTGGTGAGAGLGSQDAVIVSDDGRLLFAVNAGSGSVSAFRIRAHGLELAGIAPSGGSMPTSLTYRKGLLYVLNAGVPNSISGLAVGGDGSLAPLPGSTRPLSAASTAPAEVNWSDGGDALVVTERATNRLTSYAVGADGLPSGAAVVTPSSGPTPFGFAITKRDTVFVSEAGAGGGASTYALGGGAVLTPVSSMLMTGQRAACWAVATKNGRFGYVTNAGTGNISGFALAEDGSGSLLDADGVTAVTGGNPTDAALSHDSTYLYARVAALGRIAIFRVAADGSLAERPALEGAPAGLAGLAAW